MVATPRRRRASPTRASASCPSCCDPGDLVVINNSATLPAAVTARRADGSELELRLRRPGAGPGRRLVDRRAARRRRRARPRLAPLRRDRSSSPAGATAALVAPYAGGAPAVADLRQRRRAAARVPVALRPPDPILLRQRAVAARGVPDRLRPRPRQRRDAQRRAAVHPALITALVARGVLIAPLTLHTGLSSPERDEAPQAERFEVPATTADAVNAAHGWGGRVIAVGTTVARALETRRRAGRDRPRRRRAGPTS